MRLLPLLLLATPGLLLTACDSTDDAPDEGEHETRVQGVSQADGEFDDQLRGPALFAVVLFEAEGVERFEIQLQMETADRYHQVTLDFHDADPPRARTFPCDAPQEGTQNEVTFEYLRITGPPLFRERFRGAEGEVIITEVSDDEIRGTVDCRALSAGGTQTIAVTGTFRARRGG